MTNNTGVLAQFRVPEEFLLERDNPLGKFLETDKIRRYLSRKGRAIHSRAIKDLRSGMKHVNLKAKSWRLQNHGVLLLGMATMQVLPKQ